MAFPRGLWFHIMVYVVNSRQYLLKFFLPFPIPKPNSLFRIAIPISFIALIDNRTTHFDGLGDNAVGIDIRGIRHACIWLLELSRLNAKQNFGLRAEPMKGRWVLRI